MKRTATARTPGRLAGLAGLVALVAAGSAPGDEAELFIGARGGAEAANVLFIIDTSGSMQTLVATQATWTATTTFQGCFRSDALYVSATGALPNCSSAAFVPKAANLCAASSQPLARTGFFQDFILAWDPVRERWTAPATDGTTGPLECQADRGVHGDGAGPGLYAADGPDGPWAGDPAQEPGWTERYTLYDGNWLNWTTNPPSVERTRLEIVQEVVGGLLDSLRDVNVGVMQFNRSDGGAVIYPVSPVNEARDDIRTVVNGLQASGATPLAESLYEATRYFLGGAVDFGNIGPIRSVAGARLGNNPDGPLYRSPVTDPCSRSFVILLTDGEPVEDQGADSRVAGLPEFTNLIGPGCDGSGDGRCLDDLAEYLRRHDLRPDLPGIQNVITHTVGFDLDLPLLESTARRGGGEYRLADDTASLARALGGIVLAIGETASTFATPTVPVDAFNRIQNVSDVYVAVFQPGERARWLGNLKKYRLDGGVLVGRDGRAVVDPLTGQFSTAAWSFWSAAPDGNRATEGGAASRLPAAAQRKVLTNLVGPQLITIGNRLNPENPFVLAAMTEVPADLRRPVIDWALGRDVTDADGDGNVTKSRGDMGDPFRVQPVTLTYGGSAANPVTTVFLATNDGFLHAIDAESGEERWAFVPARLLTRLYTLYRNDPASVKQYGLDGQPALHILNDDGLPGLTGPERAILLFGMGRGGDGVFALDVTDRDAPRILWELGAADPEFADLGQTWSPPVAARVVLEGAVRDVAFFGGGYDPGQDNDVYRTDGVGNAIYMVDLLTGARLWSAGSPSGLTAHDLTLPAMQHSIPARLRVLDLDGDNLADRLYVGDMGGRLWRFDVGGGTTRRGFGAGGVLASLGGAAAPGGDPAPADLRRFYETPDAVPVRIEGQLVIALNIGSGYRGRPLDTVIDETFFSVRDFDFFGRLEPEDYPAPVTIGQLVDITDNPLPELPASVAGWRLRLVQGAGEKVLAPALTLDNTIFFLSFTPGTTASQCIAGTGINRLYVLSLLEGSALTNLDQSTGDGPLTVSDRFLVLAAGTPISGISPIQTAAGTQICVGAECFTAEQLPIRRRPPIWRTYWFEDEVN